MTARQAIPFLAIPLLAASASGDPARAQSLTTRRSGYSPMPMTTASPASTASGQNRMPTATVPAAVSGGWQYYGPPYFVTLGPQGPIIVMPPGPWMNPTPVIIMERGALGGPAPQPPPLPAPRPPARPSDPSKAAQLLTIGDRLFRAGNYKRAEERYRQAVSAAPDSAAPRARLSQVSLVRGDYAEAAARLREAIAVEPNWLALAKDVREIFPEPPDFAKLIERLESRILVEPSDRDAWLMLGAELYLSGQTRRASDIFLRITDRKPDPALAEFLDASRARE